MKLEHMLQASPVLPVIALERLDQALPLAEALLEGGLSALEITLRTPVGLDAIRLISHRFPGARVGAGTVTTPEALRQVEEAGAAFAVSPGLTPALIAAARESSIPLLPGVMSPSEVMATVEAGFRLLKLFPAEQVGGVGMLKALAGPFPGLRFCPTGGVTPESAPAYLSLPNVICVGGSWLTPKASLDAGDWKVIMDLARRAAALAH
ncbi:bifunctional 4-hydroxy-2-oxoglutarate aldolase/2-dehydro-3-deoxy-phosphogluconate aldolase [Geothrix sp. PMB-07]|uniref:bifunctional 4-hydroxy-2-oxoglutarate aldolase/2-dehydro-3-deoxy-phosphogluconate aldolase n=1 Tax=Geothrix sp. PMB-07 TaxID=3068640 RepID=UPI0027409976|nr:bifunctional 4-hydroxy-2-oxoglutarate aldolase/2-dehydro-3-deoxy-phosphogluconate aldolase [Geothrix sp. PMB-07]WLT31691.1 bifunctional 4-hydroxy-2-oxoglutarate aldolase/2-dehydro-3-deoxy-phosphogluconate aldolase [Geothrix sp. PMB-07]